MAVAFRQRWNNFTRLQDGVTLNTKRYTNNNMLIVNSTIKIKSALVSNVSSKQQIVEKYQIITHRKQLWFQLHNAIGLFLQRTIRQQFYTLIDLKFINSI